MLIADAENGRIRRVDSTTGIITTVAGNDDDEQEPSEGRLATDVNLNYPYALAAAADGGFLFYGRTNTLWHVHPVTGLLRRVAGNGSPYTSGDGGPATDAGVGFTAHLASNEAADVFLDGLGQIRRVSGETGIISTVAGTGDRLPEDDGRPATSTTNGIVKLVVTDRDRAGSPRQGQVVVTGKNGRYPVAPGTSRCG